MNILKTDSEHIDKAKNGDQNSFTFLLNNYWLYVYNYLLDKINNEDEAEDIAIKSFAKAFEKINTYNDKFTFKTWLITIAKNLYIDELRKKKTITVSINKNEDKIFEIEDQTPSIEDKIITEQNLNQLLKNIKKLKPHYQEIIQLRYFKELSYIEISDSLNEPMSNVKVKLLRARKLLAEIIKKN